MKSFDFLSQFGNISDKYILEVQSMGKYEAAKPKGRLFGKTLLVAALVISVLAVTAYAAGRYLGIWDMTKGTYFELPQTATEYIEPQTVQENKQDWSCSVVETLFDKGYFMVTVGVSGGDKYILMPEYVEPEQPVSEIGLEGEQTIGEYAESVGKKILRINASITNRDELGVEAPMLLVKNQSESEATLLISGQRDPNVSVTEAACRVTAWEVGTGEEDIQRVELAFPVNEAPEGESKVLYAQDPQAVPGMIVRSVTVTETATGTMLEFDDEITDETIFSDLKRGNPREVTWKEGGGWIEDASGKLRCEPWRVEGTVGDTLTVDYYNWDNEIIGTLVFQTKDK